MKKKYLAIIVLASLLTACIDPASQYRANVFDSSQVNSRKEAKLINILSLEPGKVKVDNTANQKIAATFGLIVGALLGANENTNSAIAGGIVGGSVAEAVAGPEALVDGVNILYSENGQILNSVQIGKMCEFSAGPAMVLITQQDETRVQPNAASACVKGQENIAGLISKYQADATVLNLLQNAKTGHQDELSELERKKNLLSKKTEVQREITALSKEERRTQTAKQRADLEVDAATSIIDSVKATNEATRDIGKGLGEGLSKGVSITPDGPKKKAKN